MDVLVYVAISVGVLSGVWAWMAAVFGMVSWTGFVGWTSYYSSGGMAKGLFRSLCSNATGIIYALLIIKGSSIFCNTSTTLWKRIRIYITKDRNLLS